jgi:hypothetical protein
MLLRALARISIRGRRDLFFLREMGTAPTKPRPDGSHGWTPILDHYRLENHLICYEMVYYESIAQNLLEWLFSSYLALIIRSYE